MDKDITNREKAADVFNRELVRRTADTSGKLRELRTDEDGDYTGKHIESSKEQPMQLCVMFAVIPVSIKNPAVSFILCLLSK